MAVVLSIALGSSAHAAEPYAGTYGGKVGGCSGKRKVKAELEPGGGGAVGPFIPARDTGHYAGQSNDGLPVSFDVVEDAAAGEHRMNLAIDVRAECYDENSEDDIDFWMTTHSAASATRSPWRAASTPTSPSATGTSTRSTAASAASPPSSISVISGYFDLEGNPATEEASRSYCDSYGAPYQTTLQK